MRRLRPPEVTHPPVRCDVFARSVSSVDTGSANPYGAPPGVLSPKYRSIFMQFKLVATVAAFAILGAAGQVEAATQLADGGFELQAATVGSYCYFGLATPGGPACPTGAWTGTSGLQDEGNSPFPGQPTVDGSKYGFVQVNGTLEQTFTANDTGLFSLSWMEAGRPSNGAGGNESYNVLLNNSVLGSFGSTTGQAFTARSTGPFALVSGTNYTLTFQGTTTYLGSSETDNTAYIDQVSLSQVGGAVPEPAAWALMIMGFGSAGVMLRRRRAAVAA